MTPDAPERGARARPGDAGPRPALARCVGDIDSFLRDHWDRRFLLHCQPPTNIEGLLSLDDVDELLSAHNVRPPAFRIVRDGRPLPRSAYTRRGQLGGRRLDDLPDPGRVFALFDSGATIALQGLHRYWPPVAQWCRELERQLTHPVQANAYLTPPGSRGLDIHHDTHDVFALQTAGRKRWVVHEPAVDAPLPRQRWRASDHQPGPLVLDTELTPGDCLYLPRGTPHAAETLDAVSLHLTIGIRPVTWYDVLQRAIARAADVPDFREALPPGFASDGDLLASQIAARLKEAASWLEQLDGGALSDEVIRQALTGRPPSLRGQLHQLLRVDQVHDDTVVQQREGAGIRLRSRRQALELLLSDRRVDLPARAEPAVRRLLNGEPSRVGDLADLLDADSRLVLVRRLIREGALVTVEAGVDG